MPPHPETGADPGLTDLCIYMEAVAGDLGIHKPWPPSAFWLSPDILLNIAPLTGPGGGAFPTVAYEAAIGANAVGVRVHKDNNCNPSSTDIEVHLYAGDPSLAMIPPPDPSTVEIGSGIVPAASLSPAGFVQQLSDWTPSTDPKKPDGPGHKCLIARAFPDNQLPDPSNFYLPLDAHVVQHNVCIQPCTMKKSAPGHGGAGVPDPKQLLGPDPNTGTWDFPFHTVNPDRNNAQVVTARVQPVLKPDKRMLSATVPKLRAVHGFRRPAPYAPRRFSISVLEQRDVAPRTDVTLLDRSRSFLGGIGRFLPFPLPLPIPAPRYDAQFRLDPHRRAIVVVHADLSGTKVGDAHFFNVTHSQGNRTIGGATLVLVRAN